MHKGVVLIIAGSIFSAAYAQGYTEAEVLAVGYGMAIGHIDHCDLVIDSSKVEEMAESLKRSAIDNADLERATLRFERSVQEAKASPSLDCETVQWMIDSAGSE